MKPKTEVTNYLKRSGLKKYQLADLAGIPRSSLYRWLNGQTVINLTTWMKLKRVLDRAA
jgi:plasmid maintenance system antidote protein VapI